MNAYDIVILGAGSAGYAAALRAAQLGLSVCLIEEDKIGGTCLHRGCIPTKAYLHAAEVAEQARHGAAVGVHVSLARVDLAGVRDYADGVVGRLHRGLTGLIAQRKITVVQGSGHLERTADGVAIRVGEEFIRGRYTVLASGSTPKTLGLPIDGTKIVTSREALRMTTLPSSALVLGGGVIGVEFASAWRSFGVDVTIVEALDSLVPNEDPEIAKALTREFGKRGIVTRTGTPMESVETTESGVKLRLASGDSLDADVLLVAVGRGPLSEGLGYAEAGIGLDRGHVVVDERLQTSLPQVYAVGDLVAGLQLAHRGFAHGIFAAEEIAYRELERGAELAHPLERRPTLVAEEQYPRVTYCDPEIASVGLSEEAARRRFGSVECFTYGLGGNGKSQILQTRGFVKVVRRTDGPVLGVHMIGARVGELIGEAQLITNWEAHPDEVAGLIHAHPTQHEALGEAHLALAGKPLHSHD